MAKVAILGFGTVGSGVAEVLQANGPHISEKVHAPVELKYILDVRDFPDSPFADKIIHDFGMIEADPEVDIVVETIGGAKVTGVRDYKTSVARDLTTGAESTILLPKSNVLELLLGDKGSVIARPSGTEPKVKFYYTSVAPTKEEAKAQLDAMVKQMSK